MYDKEAINALFREYALTENLETLSQLIVSLDDMINVCLSRWRWHKRFWPDAGQEIRMRLWKNLERRKEGLGAERYIKNPTAYLYFLIRTYANRAFRSVSSSIPMLSLDVVLEETPAYN